MRNEMFKMVLVLTLFCVVAAGLLAKVNDITRAPIAEAKAEETRQALRGVLPPFDNKVDEEFVEKKIGIDKKGNDVMTKVYTAKQQGKIIGRAFVVVAHDGYGGDIEIMMGVSPEGKITGIEILSLSETPGLGAKIASVETWPGRGSGPGGLIGKSLENNLKAKKDGGEIDQITGATISPRAVVSAVKKGLEFHKHEFQG